MEILDPASLDCLIALVDTGSFDAAARRLSVTQSAVSQRLRAMETRLGRPLVVRVRPLRLTEPGKLLLRYARRMLALRADLSNELSVPGAQDLRLPIAVNADSLATWVLPALDGVVHEGQQQGFGLELIVDDQDFTHDWLREGQVLGCVTTVARPLRGCEVRPLGTMRYIAVASPSFAARAMPKGLNGSNFARQPYIVFNRKDDMHAAWAVKAFGVRQPRLMERWVPSSEAHVRAVVLGWGIGVMPQLLARPHLEAGTLVAVGPRQTDIDVRLHWHQWKLLPDDPSQPSPVTGALERIGRALADGARSALRPPG